MNSGAPKGTSWAEVTTNSEKIKPTLLSYTSLKTSGRQEAGRLVGRKAGVKVGEKAGGQAGGQTGRQAVSRKFKKKKNP